MNKSMIRYIIGWILNVEAAFMILPVIIAIIYKETSGFAFIKAIIICWAIGIPATLHKPKNRAFYAKEGLVTVALSWIVLSLAGALPFLLSKEIPHFADAIFEIVSGFTTTGASILTDVEALSKSIIFWRSFTHWIGGMGVLVFILAILPMAGGHSMHLMRAESPGFQVGKLVPRLKTTAMILYTIYFGMTVVQVVLLLLGGMHWFDALTITFGTAGTGGFAVKNASMAAYPSYYLQTVTTIFMILFGVNFNVYYLFLIRKPKAALLCEEARWYLIIIASAIVAIALNINGAGIFSLFDAFHHAAFQVASIITTTGYATADFNQWPIFSKTILVLLMFVGACAGSTGGGIKVSRIVIMIKQLGKEIRYAIDNRSIKVLKFEGKKLEKESLHSINLFLIAYFLIFAVSSLLVSLDNFDMTTNFTAIATTINNVGPGLEMVGPTGNFSAYSDLSKFTMSFNMLAGRLELFPMLILFMPGTWRRS